MQNLSYARVDEYIRTSRQLFNPLVFETIVSDETNNEITKPSGNMTLTKCFMLLCFPEYFVSYCTIKKDFRGYGIASKLLEEIINKVKTIFDGALTSTINLKYNDRD